MKNFIFYTYKKILNKKKKIFKNLLNKKLYILSKKKMISILKYINSKIKNKNTNKKNTNKKYGSGKKEKKVNSKTHNVVMNKTKKYNPEYKKIETYTTYVFPKYTGLTTNYPGFNNNSGRHTVCTTTFPDNSTIGIARPSCDRDRTINNRNHDIELRKWQDKVRIKRDRKYIWDERENRRWGRFTNKVWWRSENPYNSPSPTYPFRTTVFHGKIQTSKELGKKRAKKRNSLFK